MNVAGNAQHAGDIGAGQLDWIVVNPIKALHFDDGSVYMKTAIAANDNQEAVCTARAA